jgi:PAS domain-containing protein
MRRSNPSKQPPLAAELIVANAPDPVFVCDLHGKILVANDAVSQLLGLRRDQVLEQSLSGFLSTTETRKFVAANARGCRTGCDAQCPPRAARCIGSGDSHQPERRGIGGTLKVR